MSDLNLDFCYKEYSALREELNDIKKAQLGFITFSVTATGILLGIGWRENSTLPLSAAYLFPLIILLPFWHLFFDKATTITRIVGYQKVLEKIIINPASVRNFTGWENALVIFRGRQQQKILQKKKDKRFLETYKISFKERISLLTYLTSVRYWLICYLVFLFLSWLCISMSIFYFLHQPFNGILLFIISGLALLTVFSSWWNGKLFCYLARGRYSSRINEFLWKQIILRKMILEHERLVEYGGILWRAKALNFEGGELDFSDYGTLVIRGNAKGEVNVQVQLVNSLNPKWINSPAGLYRLRYPLKEADGVTEIKIPLREFKGIDLQRVYRLIIHYGREVFGEEINSANDNKINIEEIELRQ